jgi:predicted nucleic acid-binding protein
MGSTLYPDSSFLVSLVCQDSNSAKAGACMIRMQAPLLFTPLHRNESRNALRNAAARGLITENDRRGAFRQLDQDLRDGLLVHTLAEWTDILRRADELSEKHAAVSGQRTIDLLHVAFALECGARIFLSFDNRQCSLAEAAGLEVKP